MAHFSPTRTAPPRLLLAACLVAGLIVGLVPAGCGDSSSNISIRRAVTPEPPTPDQAVVYLTIRNSGGGDDELVGVSTKIAPMAHLHSNRITTDGRSMMTSATRLRIPAGHSVRLSAGGLHIMLMEPKPLRVGRWFDLALRFRQAGEVTAHVRVIDRSTVVR